MDTCRRPGRAGLAAPQIGVDLRVFCYNVDGEEGYLINPRLVSCDGHQDGLEGCLSIPGLYLPTPRAGHAVVTGVDLDGQPVTVEGTGVLARCLQHEVDHLDGHLFLDRLPADERRQALRALRGQLGGPGRPERPGAGGRGLGGPGLAPGGGRRAGGRIYRSSLNRPRSRSKAGLGE